VYVLDRSTVADASSSAIDPMTFDLVNVNQGSLYNSNNGIVTISTTGYYYLYISAGAAARQVSQSINQSVFISGSEPMNKQ